MLSEDLPRHQPGARSLERSPLNPSTYTRSASRIRRRRALAPRVSRAGRTPGVCSSGGPSRYYVIGEDANELEAVQTGLIQDPDEVKERSGYPGRNFFDEVVVPWVKRKTARQLAKNADLSVRQVRHLRNGYATPQSSTRRRLEKLARLDFS